MKYIIPVILLSLVISASGQKNKATEILDKVKEKTESYPTIKVHFTYEMVNEEVDVEEKFEGMLVLKDDSYRLRIAGQEIICDGHTLWTYIEDAQEVQINEVEEDEDAITPARLFSSYYEEFEPDFVKESESDGAIIQIIDLYPREERSFDKIQISIQKDDYQITEVSIFDKNGNIYSYRIKDFIGDYAVDDTYFTFDEAKYPDVDIIDMR